MKIKHLPFEIYGRWYELLGMKKFAKNFLPDDWSIRVLCYHDIPEGQLANFERQIIWLKKEYKIIMPEEMRNFFLGRGFLPGTNIFITFDDGSVDQYRAAEILEKHGIGAAFFVAAEDIGQGRVSSRRTALGTMTWAQLRALHKRGHTIGSHTVTHPKLGQLQPYQVQRELAESKKLLEGKIGGPVDTFAFPYGTDQELSDETRLIANAVYDFVFTFLPGGNRFDTADRHFIRRLGVSPDYSLYHLRALAEGIKDR